MEPMGRGMRVVGVCFGALVLAGAASPSDSLGALSGALAEGQAHTAPLSAQAANAP